MNPATLDLIAQRSSINRFDTSYEMDDASIVELVRHATQAPSAYNMQNWRFVAVRTPEQKARLCDMAYGQKKVLEASVTFIVCGRLNPHLALRAALQPFRDAGHVDAATIDAMVGSATQVYEGDAQMQRDEAIRSGALAGMTLMIAAQAMDLVSGPMIGFDPEQVTQGFGLGADEIPVMLITVGRPAPGNWPKKPRRSAALVVDIV
ncbi:MAG: nitroreductase family protein [Burkholderiales bacterium]